MFREPIGSFIAEQKAKLYIPKNSGLNEYVNALLREIGVDERGAFDRLGQSKGVLEIVPTRGEDVPKRVDDCILRGEAAYGLTGDDLFNEYMLGAEDAPLAALNTYDWFDANAQFYRPALCLLNRTGKIPDGPATVSLAVNKKYERTSRQYLAQRFGAGSRPYSVVAYAGDTENTVAEGTHDGCVEVVYCGSKSAASATSTTGLKVAEVVRFSDISLVGRKVANPWAEEYRRIAAVAENPAGSATAKLLDDNNGICKKAGEESAEFVRAFVEGSGIAGEFNDVVYALMVAAAKRRVPWRALESDLMARWK